MGFCCFSLDLIIYISSTSKQTAAALQTTQEGRGGTDFDVGLLRLHQLADDLAEFVGVGELPLSGGGRRGRQGRHGAGRERRGRRGGGRRHGALQRVHVVETPAEGGDLLRALRGRKEVTAPRF